MPPPTIFHPLVEPKTKHHRLVMFHIVREGTGWVHVEGFEPERLEKGDLIIVLDDLDHHVLDHPDRPTVQSRDIIVQQLEAGTPVVADVGCGEVTLRLVCGMLQFEDRGFNPAFSALPPYILIKRDEGPSTEWLQANLNHIIVETDAGRPGSQTLLSRLTELLFVETLRCFFDRMPEGEKGWFVALRDPIVGKALQLIHDQPEHRWTLVELSKRAGVSRSGLAARFSELLSMAPMTYITRWRIRLAMGLIETPQLSIANVAARVGYESESAFHRAFKRETKLSPAAFRRQSLGEAAYNAS